MENIHLILNADIAIKLHVCAAFLAVFLTPFAILRKRRDAIHKVTGYAWVISLGVTALSSFWISGIELIGPFSPIHLISIWTIFVLYKGVRLAIRRDIVNHQREMRSLAFGALGIAGSLSFLPGRRMNLIFFPDAPFAGFLFVMAVLGLSVLLFGKPQVARRILKWSRGEQSAKHAQKSAN